MENFKKFTLDAPEGYRGLIIGIDELSPKFNDDGTLEITGSLLLDSPKDVGGIVRIISTQLTAPNDRRRSIFAQVLEVNGSLVKLKILD